MMLRWCPHGWVGWSNLTKLRRPEITVRQSRHVGLFAEGVEILRQARSAAETAQLRHRRVAGAPSRPGPAAPGLSIARTSSVALLGRSCVWLDVGTGGGGDDPDGDLCLDAGGRCDVHGLQPRRATAFQVGRRPRRSSGEMSDVVGPCLSWRDNLVVFWVGDKSQMAALDGSVRPSRALRGDESPAADVTTRPPLLDALSVLAPSVVGERH